MIRQNALRIAAVPIASRSPPNATIIFPQER